MTLKLQPAPVFSCAVPITVPGQEARAIVNITFKHLAKSALREFFSGLEGKSDAEALAEIVSDWSGVDEKFSRDALGVLLDNYPAAAGELFDAFRKELLEARAKN
jgi:hypothetical protein